MKTRRKGEEVKGEWDGDGETEGEGELGTKTRYMVEGGMEWESGRGRDDKWLDRRTRRVGGNVGKVKVDKVTDDWEAGKSDDNMQESMGWEINGMERINKSNGAEGNRIGKIVRNKVKGTNGNNSTRRRKSRSTEGINFGSRVPGRRNIVGSGSGKTISWRSSGDWSQSTTTGGEGGGGRGSGRYTRTSFGSIGGNRASEGSGQYCQRDSSWNCIGRTEDSSPFLYEEGSLERNERKLGETLPEIGETGIGIGNGTDKRAGTWNRNFGTDTGTSGIGIGSEEKFRYMPKNYWMDSNSRKVKFSDGQEPVSVPANHASSHLLPGIPVANHSHVEKSCYVEEVPVKHYPIGKRRCKRWCWFVVMVMIIIILGIIGIILGVILVKLRKRGGESPNATVTNPGKRSSSNQIQWASVPGYPSIPLGMMIVKGRKLEKSVDGCVDPRTLWSCWASKEEQNDLEPYRGDELVFFLEINQLKTSPSGTGNSDREIISPDVLPPVNSTFNTNLKITSSPQPPDLDDQIFLAKTTDKMSSYPLQGEQTPFIISLYSLPEIQSQWVRESRQNYPGSPSKISKREFWDTFPPSPDQISSLNGTVRPGNLLPRTMLQQPLRLYNRGSSDEYYGFYNYFDRGILLKSLDTVNTTNDSYNLHDDHGGSILDAARWSCLWRQTRLRLQLWTATINETAKSIPNFISNSNHPNSSINGISRFSKSFPDLPIPASITIDRHGGTLNGKMITCYQVSTAGILVRQSGKLHVEQRDYSLPSDRQSAQIINPSRGPFEKTPVKFHENGPGGIDGGNTGCICRWTTS